MTTDHGQLLDFSFHKCFCLAEIIMPQTAKAIQNREMTIPLRAILDCLIMLVGRMVRTPLARRISTNEVLDTVELFLPHYNREAVEKVLESLRNPTEGLGIRAEIAAVTYGRDSDMAKIFEHLKTLPTYAVSHVPKMTEVKRVLRLAGLLMHVDLNKDADDEMRESLLKKLKELREHYAKTVSEWGNVLREGGEIEVDSLKVVTGQMTIAGLTTTRMRLSGENIEQLFDAAGRLLAAGEGLHRSYWKKFHDHANPNAAKLELIAIAQQQQTIPTLERFAWEQFEAWWKRYKNQIKKLPASVRSRFYFLVHASGKAVPQDWELPEQIVEKKEGRALDNHLFCDSDKKFWSELNSWEKELLTGEMDKKDFVGWLRNLDRRDWSLCVPYDMGGIKGFYPDLIIIRKTGKGFVADILEPHNPSFVDTIPKAIGLAKFADEHGEEFGRIVIARKKGEQWQVADLQDKKTREKIKAMQSGSPASELFE